MSNGVTTDDPTGAMTEGLRFAFLVATGFAVLGLAVAFLLPGRRPVSEAANTGPAPDLPLQSPRGTP